MATLEELQQQLAVLQQKVEALTTPPTDYYTHRWSGEEIDNAVDRSRTGGSIDAALSNKADKTPPQEYDLPLADGVAPTTTHGGYKNTYHRNQFGEVTVSLGVEGEFSNGMTLFTLPEGHRPSGNIAIPCYATDPTYAGIQSFILVMANGNGKMFTVDGSATHLALTSGSFLASTA